MRKKIAVAGAGYVGLSLSVLLAQFNQVYVVSTTKSKVESINCGISPIVDDEISKFLSEGNLNITATANAAEAYSEAELVIVATPTNFDPLLGCLTRHPSRMSSRPF